MNFDEFEGKIDQILFVSATPGEYEADHELLRAEQVIRPTGLLDPRVEVRPVEGQIDDLVGEVNKEAAAEPQGPDHHPHQADGGGSHRTTCGSWASGCAYLHSDIDTLERTQIIRDMRLDVFDVLVGINLLPEGLDIPEVTLVAILDADKEGFLRSEASLIQTIGRAARNAEGHVIMYADTVTDSMRLAIDETNRRRRHPGGVQSGTRHHAEDHSEVRPGADQHFQGDRQEELRFEKDPESMSKKELEKLIADIDKKMKKAAAELNFELAAELRDKMIELKKQLADL